MKFPPESFTKFDKEDNRLSSETAKIIAKYLVECFEMELIGADILIEEQTGNLYIIDVNYFSSYENLKNINVHKAFKELILRKH